VSEPGLVSLLIPAVGGQGGGVLSEWIVEAAGLDGYRVHGTSIPGVAQRTGSTRGLPASQAMTPRRSRCSSRSLLLGLRISSAR